MSWQGALAAVVMRNNKRTNRDIKRGLENLSDEELREHIEGLDSSIHRRWYKKIIGGAIVPSALIYAMIHIFPPPNDELQFKVTECALYTAFFAPLFFCLYQYIAEASEKDECSTIQKTLKERERRNKPFSYRIRDSIINPRIDYS